MTSPLACDLGVFTPEQRARLRDLVQQVFEACRGAEELPDGYRLRFSALADEATTRPAGAAAQALSITEWITLERMCCACIAFAIEFEEDRGPIAVRMTGPSGIKPFLLAEFKGRIAEKLPHAR